MTENRKMRKREKLILEIARIAEKLIDVKDLSNIPMTRIADEAMISTASLYLYVHSQENVLFIVGSNGLELLLRCFDGIDREEESISRWRVFCERYIAFQTSRPITWSIIHDLERKLGGCIAFDKRSTTFTTIPTQNAFKNKFILLYISFLNNWTRISRITGTSRVFSTRILPYQRSILFGSSLLGFLAETQIQQGRFQDYQGNSMQAIKDGLSFILEGLDKSIQHSESVAQLSEIIKKRLDLAALSNEAKATYLKSVNHNFSQKSKKKSQSILDAIEKVYENNSDVDIPMDQIARDIKISRTTLYKYFSSKEEIHVHLAFQFFFELSQLIGVTGISSSRDVSTFIEIAFILFELYLEKPVYYRISMKNLELFPHMEEFKHHFRDSDRISLYMEYAIKFNKSYTSSLEKCFFAKTSSGSFTDWEKIILPIVHSGVSYWLVEMRWLFDIVGLEVKQAVSLFLSLYMTAFD